MHFLSLFKETIANYVIPFGCIKGLSDTKTVER